jgi:hypothetical protein
LRLVSPAALRSGNRRGAIVILGSSMLQHLRGLDAVRSGLG